MKTLLKKSIAGMFLLLLSLSFANATDIGTILIFCCDTTTYDITKPNWSEYIINTQQPNNFLKYFSDLTNGQYALDAVVLPPGEDMYQTTVHPYHAPGAYYAGVEFYSAILDSADPDLDFSLYDLNNDTCVDKTIFIIVHDFWVAGVAGYSLNYSLDGVSFNTSNNATAWVIEGERDCYSKYFSLIAHENNHLGPVNATNMLSYNSYFGLGSFENMAGGGFADSINGTWYPSMINPYYRIYKGFIDPIEVNSSCLMNQQIDDYLTNNEVYKLTANLFSNQYFLVTNHMRELCWEWMWPTKGMLIWHIYPSGGWSSRDNEKVDIEAASGNYTWVCSDTITVPTDSVDTDLQLWNNTGTPNANAGYDSLDFWWSGTEQNYYPLYPPGKIGSQFFFYKDGSEFSKDTNPNSNFIQNGSQSWITNIGIFDITQDAFDNLYADLAPNCIYSNITQNTTWDEDALVMNDITIAQNVTLTIEPGVTVYFKPDAQLVVEGEIVADGENIATPITFKCSESEDYWDGIYIDNSPAQASNYFAVCNFEYAECGIDIINSSNVEITGSTFENCSWGIKVTNSEPNISVDNYFLNNLTGIWVYDYSNPIIYDNRFDLNDIGIICLNYSGGQIGSNYFLGNELGAIVCFGGSNPKMYYDAVLAPNSGQNWFYGTSEHMQDPTIYANNNSYPMIGYVEPYPPGNNSFNGTELGGVTYYIENDNSAGRIFAQRNLWNNGLVDPNENDFSGEVVYIPWLESLEGGPAGNNSKYNNNHSTSGNGLGGASSLLAEYFEQGQLALAGGNYNLALTKFGYILTNAANSDYAPAALSLMIETYRSLGWNNQIASYLQPISAAAYSNNLEQWANLMSAPLLNNQAQYSAALNIYSQIAANQTLPDDIRSQGMFNEAVTYLTKLDDPETACDLLLNFTEEFPENKLAMLSAKIYEFYTGVRISTIGEEQPVSANISVEDFSLSENFPNPFNASTNITFHLPKSANISLIVYDITGREIIRLAEGYRLMGIHQVTFNANNLSSGVYFAVLKVGNYTKTQKMLLVK